MAERYGECVNCRRIRPESLLNKEGRCETCGTRETEPAAADPKQVGPHGEAKGQGAKGSTAEAPAKKDTGPAGEGSEELGDKLKGKGESE